MREMMKPTVGRIVHFWKREFTKEGQKATEVPAIITKTYDDPSIVDLCIFFPFDKHITTGRTEFWEDVRYTEEPSVGSWSWPKTTE